MNPYVRVAATLAALVVPMRGVGQSRADAPNLATALDSVVRGFAEVHAVPGLSVAVALDGVLRYEDATGLADVEAAVPATPATLFRIASVTKPLTAVAVLRLADSGRLDLDAPADRYCPSFTPTGGRPTARQLLAHLGGVRDYSRVERGVWRIRTHEGWSVGSSPHHYSDLGEAVAVFANDTLASSPGEEHRYSNVGYLVLGCAIEGATGASYPAAVAEEVFLPAGMTRTRPDDAWAIIPGRARPYQMRGTRDADWWWWTPTQKETMEIGRLYNARFEDTSLKLSAGGMLSTAGDLARFGLALESGRLLADPMLRAMLTPQRTAAGEPTTWGLGVTVDRVEDRTSYGLSGGQPGASALLRIDRGAGLVIAAVANRDLLPLDDLAAALRVAMGR